MTDKFAEVADELTDEQTDDDQLSTGDECPEGHCERELHEKRHPRNPQLETEPHPDAPEIEVVCVEDGIVATR